MSPFYILLILISCTNSHYQRRGNKGDKRGKREKRGRIETLESSLKRLEEQFNEFKDSTNSILNDLSNNPTNGNDDDHTNILNMIDDIEQDIDGLNTQITTINNNINGLQNQYNTLNQQLSDTTTGLTSNINTLQSQVSTIQSDIDTLSTQSQSAFDTATQASNDLNTLQIQVDGLSSNSFQTKLDELETTDTNLQSQITSLSNTVNANKDRDPYLAINYIIALIGTFPSRNRRRLLGTEPFVGEISMFAGNFAPQGWALCDGQIIPISQNEALFSLIGTTYGGDGRITFALPDLRGRGPIHAGIGPGLPNYPLGQKGGSIKV